MSRRFFAALGLTVMAALLWNSQSVLGPRVSSSAEERGQTVVVVVLRDDATLAAVRSAVAPERVVAEEPSGFALREGRILASSHDAVGPLLTRVGWANARLEIVTPGSLSAPSGAASAGGGSELNALLSKRTLSPADAARALELLE